MMRNRLGGIAIFILLPAMFACTNFLLQTEPETQPAQSDIPPRGNIPQTEDEVPRISVGQAKAAIESGAAIIVDVRSAEAYAEGHMAGAISIPLAEFENDISGIALGKDQWIITYCT